MTTSIHRAPASAPCVQKLKGMLERQIRPLLCLCALGLVAGLWGVTLWQLNKGLKDELDSARRDAVNFALLLKEHATRTIESTDQTIAYLRHRYNVMGKQLNLAQDLQEGLVPDNIHNLFSIVDENANLVLSSRTFAPMNLVDREHIKVHIAADNAGLFISKPLLGQLSKKWSLQLTRRINFPNGDFKGVVIASMDIDYLTDFYKKIDVGGSGSILLIGEDGVVRASHNGNNGSVGQDLSRDTLFLDMRSNTNGIKRMTSTLDHHERLYVYQKLEPYPLYVGVGIDLNERLSSYYTARSQTLLLSSLATLLICLGTAALVFMIGHLIQSRHEAILARKVKMNFLSNMSHEFRTPLNGILGYSELLMEDLTNTRHGEYAQAIQHSGLRLLKLVESVLELSALRSGKATLEISTDQTHDIATHALSSYREMAGKKGLSLHLNIADDVPVQLQTDHNKLLQVLDKLLNNALRLTEVGGVRLDVTRDGGNVRFSIIDSGPGIADALQGKIFEKFSQVDDSASRHHDGIGLGLTIATLLIDIMGGEIAVDSKVGLGSTFSFSIPAIIRANTIKRIKFSPGGP
jgi:two-component system, NarL family, sensor histidine kinase BarA